MIQRGNCKGTHFSRNLNQETSKKETEVPNVKYEPIKKSLEEFLGEKDLQLATEDTYKSMSEKSFEEIEQDEFNHDDIEI